ncbi:hypothetical protein BEL04_01250 [Mucilaginibacter sp. PPCGB 2223]|uniref:hypothetical protein n=1 Tax=Mucilaginibacter sp. PPCGB 2223 TaxID=1886027 RepID=UPI0008252634|nr:hypothetical protein [Mucilaginibacter sp. PPCGB 2223]OCX52983.1 hypothetical protein BEL04_01250 [Mucilaginibacter sp. PPCGB 2223]
MTIQELQQQVSNAITHGNLLTIDDTLLDLPKHTGFFDLYKITGIKCSGVSMGDISGNQFTVSATDITIEFFLKSIETTNGLGITFSVDGNGDAQISFSYSLSGNLADDVNNIFGIQIASGLPAYVSNQSITGATVTLSTSPATFQFSYVCSLNIYSGPDLQLTVDIDIVQDGSGYKMEADFSAVIGGEVFDLTITDSQGGISIDASWSDQDGGLELNTLIPDLGLGFKSVHEPSAYGMTAVTALTLNAVKFSCDTGDDTGASFTFSADLVIVETNLTLDLGLYDGLSQYYVAIDLSGSSLTILSDDLSLFTGVQLDSLFVVISNFDDSTYAIPGTNYTGISDGVEVVATLTMVSTDSTGILDPALSYLGGFLGDTTIDITISYNDGDFSLTGDIPGIQINFPNAQNTDFTINGISLTISSELPQIKIGTTILLDYDFQTSPPPDITQLSIQGTLSFGCADDGAMIAFSADETTTLNNPFGINGLVINSLGISLEGSIVGTIISILAVLQGKFEVGISPNQIGGGVGVSIGIDDTEVNIPYLACNTDAPYTLADIWNATLGPQAPSFLGNVNIQKLNFYFCDQDVELPDGSTAKKGVNFLSVVSVESFTTFAALSISSSGVSGELQMSPISIIYEGKTIASVTGNSTGNPKYGIQPGGAAFSCNLNEDSLESFSTTVDVTILGLTSLGVDTDISIGGDDIGTISISLDYSFDLLGDLTFDFDFTSLTDMSLNFSVDLDSFSYTIPDVPGLGNVNITSGSDTPFSISLTVTASGGDYTTTLNCDFTWFGYPVQLTFDFSSTPFTDLTQLESVIISQLVSEASALLNAVLNDAAGQYGGAAAAYVQAIVNGAIADGKYVLSNLVNNFEVAVTDIATLFNDITTICQSGHVDYQLDFHLDYSLTPSVPPSVPLNFHVDIIGNTDITVTIPLPPLPFPAIPILDISSNNHLDLYTTEVQVKASFEVPIVDALPHVDVFGENFGLGVKAGIGVDVQVPLANFFPDGNANPDAFDLDFFVRGSIEIWSWSESAHYDTTINL